MEFLDAGLNYFQSMFDNSSNKQTNRFTNNYLSVNNKFMPNEVYINKDDLLEINSFKKESNEIESQISNFSNLIKNINKSAGFTEAVKYTLSKQEELLNSIKDKTDTLFNSESNELIQENISELISSMDFLANNSKFNNRKLLNGNFQNQKIMSSLNSSNFVEVSLNSTRSADLGSMRYETTKTIEEGGNISINISNKDKELALTNVTIGYKEGEGLGTLVDLINKSSDLTGIKASYQIASTGFKAIEAGNVENLKINDISIGSITVQAEDGNNNLVETINSFSTKTGVMANVDESGRLNLESIDGRGVKVEADSGLSTVTNIHENLPVEVKLETSYGVGSEDLSNGIKINGVVINNETPSISKFVELVNSKYDETGVKAEINDGKLTFNSKNSDDIDNSTINIEFKSISDAKNLGFIQSEVTDSISLIKSGVIDKLEISSIDNIDESVSIVDANTILWTGNSDAPSGAISIDDLITKINEKSDLTGVSALKDEISGEVKLEKADGSDFNLTYNFSSGDEVDKILNNYSSENDTFNNYFEAEDLFVEAFENYGKLTTSVSDGSNINIDVKGSYLFRDAAINNSSAIVNLQNLTTGFNSEEAEALGLFANKHIKSDYENTNVSLGNLSKDVVTNILETTTNNFNKINSSLEIIDSTIQSGLDSAKEFVNGLRMENFRVDSFIGLSKEINNRDALIPAIGSNYSHRIQMELETKLMQLILV